MKGRSRRWCFDLPGISLPSLCPTILPSPSILLTPSLFFTLSLSPLPSPSLARLLLSKLSSPFHLFVGSNPPVLRFARPPTHPPSRSPLPVHTGGNMAAPCTLDTLRLRCLITQDTSSRGNRACYRASPFPLFLLLPFFPFLSYIYSLSLSFLLYSLIVSLSVGRRKRKGGRGQNISLFPRRVPSSSSSSSTPFDRHSLKGRRWPRRDTRGMTGADSWTERRNEISLLTLATRCFGLNKFLDPSSQLS